MVFSYRPTIQPLAINPPTTFWQFSPDILIRGGSNYTQNLSFIITEHVKLVSGQKIFLRRVGGRQSREGSSFFASKLITILHSPKADEVFLLNLKSKDPKS